MTFTKQQLTSFPFPASKSTASFTTGFTDNPTPGKPHILTNYKAYQPCCCGSTRHFYRRFQLRKSCSGSWEHFQGYPMLSRGEKRIQKELQANYTRQSISASGSSSGGRTPPRNYFHGRGVVVFLVYFVVVFFLPGSLHLTVRLTFHRGDFYTFCIHVASRWEKDL